MHILHLYIRLMDKTDNQYQVIGPLSAPTLLGVPMYGAPTYLGFKCAALPRDVHHAPQASK